MTSTGFKPTCSLFFSSSWARISLGSWSAGSSPTLESPSVECENYFFFRVRVEEEKGRSPEPTSQWAHHHRHIPDVSASVWAHRFRVQRRGLSRASPRLYRVFTGFLLRVPARALLRLFFFSTAVSKIQGVISVFSTTYNWKSLYKINAIIVFCALD